MYYKHKTSLLIRKNVIAKFNYNYILYVFIQKKTVVPLYILIRHSLQNKTNSFENNETTI